MLLTAAAIILAACSKQPEPTPAAESRTMTALPPLPAASAEVLRARVDASGITAEYAAHFAADQLTHILEHREVGGAVLAGNYEFKGARLIHYSGAPLNTTGELDLEFDLQGVLQTQPEASVSEEEVRTLRNRAQLLRSHALAQRATKSHH